MSKDGDNDTSRPRMVTIYKTEAGFSFFWSSSEPSTHPRRITGEMYAFRQYISHVRPDGAAAKAGVKEGDHIMEVNGVNIAGFRHSQVVQLINSCGDCLTLTVISGTGDESYKLESSDTDDESSDADDEAERLESSNTDDEAERLESSDTDDGAERLEFFDTDEEAKRLKSFDTKHSNYYEKRSLPISIPDYTIINRTGEHCITFNIHIADRQICSRRYREFSTLHAILSKEFRGFNFPKLPGKWPLKLSEQQLDTRRRGLEEYLDIVCSIRVIAESETFQEFLTDTEDELYAIPTDIRVILPDHEVTTISVKQTANAQVVWEILVQHAQLTSHVQQYFYLFEIVKNNFERKLQPHEIPYQLYVHKYSAASSTCLCVRRWLFTIDRELTFPDGDLATEYLFCQTIDEVNRGNIRTKGYLYDLKTLKDSKKASEYLAVARTLYGYGDVVFPHCPCNSRKKGHVVPVVGIHSFRLYTCREDGCFQAEIIVLTWDSIARWETNEESMSFCFQYNRPDKPARWVRVYTQYYTFLADCFDRMMEESKWKDSRE